MDDELKRMAELAALKAGIGAEDALDIAEGYRRTFLDSGDSIPMPEQGGSDVLAEAVRGLLADQARRRDGIWTAGGLLKAADGLLACPEDLSLLALALRAGNGIGQDDILDSYLDGTEARLEAMR